MRRILVTLACGAIALTSLLRADLVVFRVSECGSYAVYGYETQDGAWIEEMVDVDHHARYMTPETRAATQDASMQVGPQNAREWYANASVSEAGLRAYVALDIWAWAHNRSEREWDEYLNARLKAEAGEAVQDAEIAMDPPPKPGILRQTGMFVTQQFEEHPVRSTLVTIGSLLLADYWEGGGINAFGTLGGSDGGLDGGGSATVINAKAEGESSVNITVVSGDESAGTSTNAQSRTDSTAAPFFPPQ